jgi:hypothetical protein
MASRERTECSDPRSPCAARSIHTIQEDKTWMMPLSLTCLPNVRLGPRRGTSNIRHTLLWKTSDLWRAVPSTSRQCLQSCIRSCLVLPVRMKVVQADTSTTTAPYLCSTLANCHYYLPRVALDDIPTVCTDRDSTDNRHPHLPSYNITPQILTL